MVGDTFDFLSWYFFDWITGDYGGDGEMSFVWIKNKDNKYGLYRQLKDLRYDICRI